MVAWCQDMPSFDSREGIELTDSVITCEIHDAQDDPEMNNLVKRLQTY